MRIRFVVLLIITISMSLSGQKDPEALQVLKEFSRTASAAPSVTIDFTLNTYDSREGNSDSFTGTVVISGDSFRLTLPDNNVYTNGITIWNYLPDENEVTITSPDPGDDSFFSKPSRIFSMYEEGYKIRLLEQSSTYWVIDLYPTDINVNLIHVRLRIGKQKYDLKEAEYKTKEGMTATLKADRYDLTYKPAGDFFIFNPSGHKGIEIIDMR